jgi:hypothetical protein
MNESLIFSLSGILYLLFHVTALTLSIVFWRRHPKVCILVLIGSLLNLFAHGVRIALPVVFRNLDVMASFALINFGISCVSIAGSSLYLAAIFIERGAEFPHRLSASRRSEDDWQPRQVPPRHVERGSTGIQE